MNIQEPVNIVNKKIKKDVQKNSCIFNHETRGSNFED